MLREAGARVAVVALADRHTEEDRALLDGIELRTAPYRGPALPAYGPGLVAQLLAAGGDLVHLHGIWLYPSGAGTLWARRRPQTHPIVRIPAVREERLFRTARACAMAPVR